MAGGLPIVRLYRSVSAPPTLPSVAAPVIVSLEQSLEHEITVWARIRAQASQRYQEYQDEQKRREHDWAEEELRISCQEKAQAEFEASSTLATVVSVSVPITVGWERAIERWAQIRAQASERYENYRLKREKERDLAEHDEHPSIPRQEQVPERKLKLSMIRKWLDRPHLGRAKSPSEQA